MLKEAKAQAKSGSRARSRARSTASGTTAQMEQMKDLAQAVMDSSHKIWLAGLGAFSKAQAEGMKVFDMLVKEGEALESQTRKAATATAEAATDAARAKAKEMQAVAGGTWDKLEQVFEERVAKALHRLGVYRSSDFKELADRVNALSDAIGEVLTGKPVKAPAAKAKAGRKPGRRPAAKKAVAGTRKSTRKTGARKTTRKTARSSAASSTSTS